MLWLFPSTQIKREPNACLVNNYFEKGLQVWKANIDIQPVFNHCKAVTHMTSNIKKEAAKEALHGSKSDYEKMKVITKAYAIKRECSV